MPSLYISEEIDYLFGLFVKSQTMPPRPRQSLVLFDILFSAARIPHILPTRLVRFVQENTPWARRMYVFTPKLYIGIVIFNLISMQCMVLR